MHRNLILFALSCVFVVLTAHAVEGADDCGSKLIRDRYMGAVLKGLENGSLTARELAVMAGAASPVNPLADQTPTSKNSGAIKLFATLARDPDVSANWAKISVRLNALLIEKQGKEKASETAAENTRLLVVPRAVRTISNGMSELKFVELDDGRAAFAHINFNGELRVEPVGGGEPFYKFQMPNFQRWLLEWHRDYKNNLYLYIAANMRSGESSAQFYRLRWGDKEPSRISDLNGTVTSFANVSPGHLIAHMHTLNGDKFYNLANNNPQFTSVIAYPWGTAAVGRSGKMHNISYKDIGPQAVIFKTAGGAVLKLNSLPDNRTINITNLENDKDPVVKIVLPEHRGELRQFKMVEWRGRFFVSAYVAFKPNRKDELFVFEPLVSKDPIHSEELDVVANNNLFWFTDGSKPLVALEYKEKLTEADGILVVDPLAKSSKIELLEGAPADWAKIGKQIYLSTRRRGSLSDQPKFMTIYSLLANPGGGS